VTEAIKTIGIIGFGFAGQLHREAVKSISPKTEILVYDLDSRKMSQARDLGCRATKTLDELLERDPQAIIVAVPAAENFALVQTIAASGKVKGILFEKPLSDSSTNAETISEIISKTQMISMIGLTGHGFHPEFRAARRLVAQGTLGAVHTIIEQIHQGGPDFPQRYLTRSYGGVIKELGIHTLDHLHYLVNVPDWRIAFAAGGRHHWHSAEPDWCETTLTSHIAGNRPQIVAHASWAFVKNFTADLDHANYSTTILGTKGKMTVYGFDRIELETSEGREVHQFHSPDSSTRDRHLPGFQAEDEAFLEAVAHGRASPLPLTYAVMLQRITDEISNRVDLQATNAGLTSRGF
jgi:predicted dehydrogenase